MYKIYKFGGYTNDKIMSKRGEVILEEFTDDIKLSDIVHGYDLNTITTRPIKRVFIGNGQPLSESKSIIIMDNSDFIIIDRDGSIIDYITNSNPVEAVKNYEF